MLTIVFVCGVAAGYLIGVPWALRCRRAEGQLDAARSAQRAMAAEVERIEKGLGLRG